MILFLADGGAPTTDEVILNKIGELNGDLRNEVVILTYGIGGKWNNG